MTTVNCSVCGTPIESENFEKDDVVTCQDCW